MKGAAPVTGRPDRAGGRCDDERVGTSATPHPEHSSAAQAGPERRSAAQARPAAKFRYPAALAVAALVAAIAAVPLAASWPYLAPIPLVPLAIAVWAWRAGTDADTEGVRVRALLGQRQVPWSRISGLVPAGSRRVTAALTDGGHLPLPAVTPADLPRLVAAGGGEVTREPDGRPPAPESPEPLGP